MTKRWVRFTVPVMVEVDCDAERITRVVALPDEVREDRDDMGHFLFYNETFIRQGVDGLFESIALSIANPADGRPFFQAPPGWPEMQDWEIEFDARGRKR